MSFVSVDFYGARQMADEIEQMGRECTEMSVRTGDGELAELGTRLNGIAADIRSTCDSREKADAETLESLRPDYSELLK